MLKLICKPRHITSRKLNPTLLQLLLRDAESFEKQERFHDITGTQINKATISQDVVPDRFDIADRIKQFGQVLCVQVPVIGERAFQKTFQVPVIPSDRQIQALSHHLFLEAVGIEYGSQPHHIRDFFQQKVQK